MSKYTARALSVMAKYKCPEETPSMLLSTVDEIESDLRERFPEVFRVARLREETKRHADQLVRNNPF